MVRVTVTAGIGAGVGAAAGKAAGKAFHLNLATNGPNGTGGYKNLLDGAVYRTVSGAAAGLASAATRSVIDGTDFGDNVIAALPDAIGNTIGNLVADGIAQSGQERALRRAGVNNSADAFEDQFGDTPEVAAYRKAGLAAARSPDSDKARANFDRAARAMLEANSSDPGVADFLDHINPNSAVGGVGDLTVTGSRDYLFGSTIDNAGIWVGETGDAIKRSVGQFVADHPGVGVALKLADAGFAVAAPGKYLAGKVLDYFKDEASGYIADKMTGDNLWSVEKGKSGGGGFVLAGSLALGGLSAIGGGFKLFGGGGVPREPTRFIDSVVVVDRKAGKTLTGTVDLGPTLDRIKSGGSFPHRNDGSIFKNLPPKGAQNSLLPVKSKGFYKEYVVPTPGVKGPGPQRIVVGKSGKMYYTPDHYDSFIPLN